MRVILVYPQEGRIYRKDIAGDLYDLQFYVDGWVEPCAPIELQVAGMEMLVNEEGLLKGLPLNENLLPFFFVGTAIILVVGEDDFVGLDQKQEEFALEWLNRLKEIR